MPPRRDLRFKVQVCKGDTPMAQFQSLEMGDLWEDANLLRVDKQALEVGAWVVSISCQDPTRVA